jgi:hypothetical protein
MFQFLAKPSHNEIEFSKYNKTPFLDGIVICGVSSKMKKTGEDKYVVNMCYYWEITSTGIKTQFEVDMDVNIESQFEQFQTLVAISLKDTLLH